MYGDVVWPELNSVLSSSTGRVLISDTPVEIDQPVPGRYPAVPISFFVPDQKVPILWCSILQITGIHYQLKSTATFGEGRQKFTGTVPKTFTAFWQSISNRYEHIA